MNLSVSKEDFSPMGSSRIHGYQTSKEQDYTFCLLDVLALGASERPSLVMEVGLSESYAQLVQDMVYSCGRATKHQSSSRQKEGDQAFYPSTRFQSEVANCCRPLLSHSSSWYVQLSALARDDDALS